MNPKRIFIICVLAVVGLTMLLSSFKMIGSNDMHTWQVWQGVSGNTAIIDTPGMYWQNFGKFWEYPRTIQMKFHKGAAGDEDGSIRTTFNDGGRASISSIVTIGLPVDAKQRMLLHQTFGGSLKNIELAVYAHLANAVKNSGPMMTATENQTGRKAEFNQIIEDQLRMGLYEMRRHEKILDGQIGADGKPIKVLATEVITDPNSGKAVIVAPSPLTQYGLTVMQFSITETEYDELTLAQFRTKQEAFLNAESSKAKRDQEIQQKLLIEAQGLRQAAESEAKANLEKVTAEMAGKQKVAVALQTKLEAETVASQKLAVATKEKETAEVAAKQAAEVLRIASENELKMAEFNLLKAQKDAEAKIVLASAAAKEIEIGGKIKQSEQIIAEIRAKRDVEVAQALSNIKVPTTIINGLGGGQGSNGTADLINMALLRANGLLSAPTTQPVK